jgi:hypothetical protein
MDKKKVTIPTPGSKEPATDAVIVKITKPSKDKGKESNMADDSKTIASAVPEPKPKPKPKKEEKSPDKVEEKVSVAGTGNGGGNGGGGDDNVPGNGNDEPSKDNKWKIVTAVAVALFLITLLVAFAVVGKKSQESASLAEKLRTAESALVAKPPVLAVSAPAPAVIEAKCDCKEEIISPAKKKKVANTHVAQGRNTKPPAHAVVKPFVPAPVAVAQVPEKKGTECVDCTPVPEFIPRKQVANAEGICGIVVEDRNNRNVIARFMLQPYSGKDDMSRKGNLQILQVVEFKMGEVKRIEGAITGVKHTDCLQAINYVESQWAKVVKNFKLPNDCIPVRHTS